MVWRIYNLDNWTSKLNIQQPSYAATRTIAHFEAKGIRFQARNLQKIWVFFFEENLALGVKICFDQNEMNGFWDYLM